jgi:hypothetical protein
MQEYKRHLTVLAIQQAATDNLFTGTFNLRYGD